MVMPNSSGSPMDCSFIEADLRSLEKELKYNDEDVIKKHSQQLRRVESGNIYDSKISLRSISDSSLDHKVTMKSQVRVKLLF